MKYYRVKAKYDNETRYTWNNHHQGVPNGIIAGNELYTPREFEKLAMCPEWFEMVEISKRAIYTCFGARFESKKGGVNNEKY
jgi:hypothetical protein